AGPCALFFCLTPARVKAQVTPRGTPAVQALLDAARKELDAKPQRVKEASMSAEEALVQARAKGDRCGEVDALRAKGNIQAALGKTEEALSLYKDSQGIAEKYGDNYGQAMALYCGGLVHQSKDRWEAARKGY